MRSLDEILEYFEHLGVVTVLIAPEATVLVTAYKLEKARADSLEETVEALKRSQLEDAKTIHDQNLRIEELETLLDDEAADSNRWTITCEGGDDL